MKHTCISELRIDQRIFLATYSEYDVYELFEVPGRHCVLSYGTIPIPGTPLFGIDGYTYFDFSIGLPDIIRTGYRLTDLNDYFGIITKNQIDVELLRGFAQEKIGEEGFDLDRLFPGESLVPDIIIRRVIFPITGSITSGDEIAFIGFSFTSLGRRQISFDSASDSINTLSSHLKLNWADSASERIEEFWSK